MARGATIYRATLELSLIDRDRYAEKTLTVARHPSETIERMVVRLLAYALRYEDALEFGRGVSATEEPDLWSRRGDGSIDQWVEVGQPDGKRLVKATRQAQQVTLFAFGEGIERWRAAQIDPLETPGNLAVARIEDGFVAALSSSVGRQLRWSITSSEGVVYWTSGDESLDTTPQIWLGDPLN
jgi:uncharacterized protein YaeQ